LKNKTGYSYYRITATCTPACLHIGVRQALYGQASGAAHIIAATDATSKPGQRDRPLQGQIIRDGHLIAATIAAIKAGWPLEDEAVSGDYRIAAARATPGFGRLSM
jgi:hypothetical protein